MIESGQVAFFGAKLLLTGRTSSDAALAVGVLAGSLPQIFSHLQNLGIPASPSDCTLALSPLCQQLLTCTKNGQPCRRSSIELHKEGKELELKHSQTFPNYERNRPFQEHYQGLS